MSAVQQSLARLHKAINFEPNKGHKLVKIKADRVCLACDLIIFAGEWANRHEDKTCRHANCLQVAGQVDREPGFYSLKNYTEVEYQIRPAQGFYDARPDPHHESLLKIVARSWDTSTFPELREELYGAMRIKLYELIESGDYTKGDGYIIRCLKNAGNDVYRARDRRLNREDPGEQATTYDYELREDDHVYNARVELELEDLDMLKALREYAFDPATFPIDFRPDVEKVWRSLTDVERAALDAWVFGRRNTAQRKVTSRLSEKFGKK